MHIFSTSFESKVHYLQHCLILLNLRCTVLRVCACWCVCVWTSQWVGAFVSNPSYYHPTNYPRDLCANKSFERKEAQGGQRGGGGVLAFQEREVKRAVWEGAWKDVPAAWIKADITPITALPLGMMGTPWCSSDAPYLQSWSNHADDNVDLLISSAGGAPEH